MTTHEGLQIHLLARVGDSEVLNEIATIEQMLEVEPITDENRTDADSATATARIQVDMAAALRACADEIDAQQGVTREPITEKQIEDGVAAAIATLQDRETGAGSDLDDDIYQHGDGVYVGIRGNVDLPQLVREILEATR